MAFNSYKMEKLFEEKFHLFVINYEVIQTQFTCSALPLPPRHSLSLSLRIS